MDDTIGGLISDYCWAWGTSGDAMDIIGVKSIDTPVTSWARLASWLNIAITEATVHIVIVAIFLQLNVL